MIARFSLYGFLKNLRFFEAFLILAWRADELSFLTIGILIAIREITINVTEIPSGALADVLGRRRCMLVSMLGYFCAFLMLGVMSDFIWLALAMVLYGVGDAFRTGTHKAMILDWLRREGRTSERTRIYGYTRSWSKIGSALSALIAGAIVFFADDYKAIFLWSALPAALNFINLASYPRYLDGERSQPTSHWLRASWSVFWAILKKSLQHRELRRLLRDSVAVEGSYALAKDYLQPVLQFALISLPFMVASSMQERTAVICGLAYALLYLLTAVASRKAHRAEVRLGGSERAIAKLKLAALLGYLAMAACLALGLSWLAVGLFLVLALLQNLWRPIHVARFDDIDEGKDQATVLSVESQAKSLTTALFAPLVGWLVDALSGGAHPTPTVYLWPTAAIAALLVMVNWQGRKSAEAASQGQAAHTLPSQP